MADMTYTSELRPEVAAPAREWSDIELARRLAYLLAQEAKKVGVKSDEFGWDLEGLARAIILASQGGGTLPPNDYRIVWQIWSIFRRNPTPPASPPAAA